MEAKTKIIGSYLSPYVRKVLVCLDLKGVPYEIDPIVPFYGNDEFTQVSPLRRIPVLIDDDVAVSDSTIICEYLDERYPAVPLLPKEAARRAHSRWYEEFADSRMGEVFIWHLYNQLVIRRFVWGEQPDEAILGKALQEEIPSILDYLETQVPTDGFLYGALGIADISLASFFRNAAFSRYEVDQTRWPKVGSYVERVLAVPAFQRLMPFEKLCLKTPMQEHRAALLDAGAPICARTWGTSQARRGVLSI